MFIKYWFGFDAAILIFLILALPESINNFGYSNYVTLLGLGYAIFLAFLQLINLVIVVMTISLAFIFFKSELGFLGYFFSVGIVNVLIIWFINKKFDVKTDEFLRLVNVHKIIIHCLILFIAIMLIYLNYFKYYLVLSVLSLISAIIFYKDLKTYSRIFIDLFNNKLINKQKIIN